MSTMLYEWEETMMDNCDLKANMIMQFADGLSMSIAMGTVAASKVHQFFDVATKVRENIKNCPLDEELKSSSLKVIELAIKQVEMTQSMF